jgi:hypothetical protein
MSGATGDRTRSAEPTSDDPVRFKLTRNGATSTLSINFIDKAPTGKTDVPPRARRHARLSNPMIMNMMKAMFQGFKINVGLEVVGAIVKTNAEYVTGPHITLLELDVAELLADEAEVQGAAGQARTRRVA